MAHSFVRGNRRREQVLKQSDEPAEGAVIDMRHLIMARKVRTCTRLTSFGKSEDIVKEENAPEEAPAHCQDGCVHGIECPDIFATSEILSGGI